MSLKNRGLEKISHSKSSYSGIIFCNQLIKYSMFLVSFWAIINTEERTLRASLCVTVVEVTETYSYHEWANLLDFLTDCYFDRTVCK